MPVIAHSAISTEINSLVTGTQLGHQLRERLAVPPAAVFAYATISHDHTSFLSGVRQALGAEAPLIGCSAQGIMGQGTLLEAGYVAGLMAIGGEGVLASSARVQAIQDEPAAKGRALGEQLLAGMGAPPKAVVIFYDPLLTANMDELLLGLAEVVDCPIVGGGAGQTFGPMVATFQFIGEQVSQDSAVALAIGGALSVVVEASTGTSPIGLSMTVTKSKGTTLLELDGRPAIDVWTELTGEGDPTVDHYANMAIGLPRSHDSDELHRVLAPFGLDAEAGGIVLQAHVPAGVKIMLHHRAEKNIFEGTEAMALRARARLGARPLRAVLGFECGARTAPFMGREASLEETKMLQSLLGADAAWLGMLAWGEVFPFDAKPNVFNYTFPILCITD